MFAICRVKGLGDGDLLPLPLVWHIFSGQGCRPHQIISSKEDVSCTQIGGQLFGGNRSAFCAPVRCQRQKSHPLMLGWKWTIWCVVTA